MARILVTGARGMLGTCLCREFSGRHQVLATARRGGEGIVPLDITDAEAVERVLQEARPDWILNAAAYTAVDRAEAEEEAAFRVNAEAPGILGRAAARTGARLLHVSTDFVFSGEKESPYVEDDPVDPLSAYGRSKEAGERAVRDAGCEHAIVRVAWLYGRGENNFVATMLRLGRERDEVRVVDDQVGTPTYAADAAGAIRRVVEADLRGTIHATNQGETTWFGLAEEALRLAGLSTRLVPITTLDYPTPARRPANSRLDNAVLRATVGDPMRPWQEALKACLEGRG